jgi:hypothetical protein
MKILPYHCKIIPEKHDYYSCRCGRLVHCAECGTEMCTKYVKIKCDVCSRALCQECVIDQMDYNLCSMCENELLKT